MPVRTIENAHSHHTVEVIDLHTSLRGSVTCFAVVHATGLRCSSSARYVVAHGGVPVCGHHTHPDTNFTTEAPGAPASRPFTMPAPDLAPPVPARRALTAADVPLLAEALPADDPVSAWLTSLAWAFGDMQIATVAFAIGHESLGEGLSEPGLFYGYRLAAAHFREAARLCGLATPQHPEILRFFNSLPVEARVHLAEVRSLYREWGTVFRAMRNGFSHYPYPGGFNPITGEPTGEQAAWDSLSTFLRPAGAWAMLVREGQLRDARHIWADHLAANIVAATVGGMERVEAFVDAQANATTALMRFINPALDERMTRAKLGLPLDVTRSSA